LIHPLRHVGIALATGATAWINLTMLMYSLHKKKHLDLPPKSVWRAVKIFVSALIMAVVLWGMQRFVVAGFLAGDQLHKALGLVSLVVGGGGCYFVSLYIFGIFSLTMIKGLFPKRIKKATMITNIEKES
ncbi:MAG: polysaccharide biosynthesis C-terminal domain-containing protein, partial [Proteobacteria bacterium]|nr:polysaccharide biosynthesis C-terminal domain-containing protein [Pseudomonadota bacterium]